MKNNTLLLFLLSFCFLLSCSSDSKDFVDDKTDKNELREGDVMNKKECFEIEYPIGIVFPNEKVTTVSDEDEFHDILKAWYKENPKEKEKPSLSYPVKVNFKEDIQKTINNEKEMMLLKEYCDKKGTKTDKPCFKLVFPISYEMPDGAIISGDNHEDIKTDLKAWYESNTGSKEKPSLVYPVDVILEDGSTMTINNEDEMIALKKKDC